MTTTSLSASKRAFGASVSVCSIALWGFWFIRTRSQDCFGRLSTESWRTHPYQSHPRMIDQLRIFHSRCSLRDRSCGLQENDQPTAKTHLSGPYPGTVRLIFLSLSELRGHKHSSPAIPWNNATVLSTWIWICNRSPDLECKDFPNYSVHWGLVSILKCIPRGSFERPGIRDNVPGVLKLLATQLCFFRKGT